MSSWRLSILAGKMQCSRVACVYIHCDFLQIKATFIILEEGDLTASVYKSCQEGPAGLLQAPPRSLSLCSAPHNNIFIWDCHGTGEPHLLIKFGWLTLRSPILKCGDVPGICKCKAGLLIDWFCLSRNKITGSVNTLCVHHHLHNQKWGHHGAAKHWGMMGKHIFPKDKQEHIHRQTSTPSQRKGNALCVASYKGAMQKKYFLCV